MRFLSHVTDLGFVGGGVSSGVGVAFNNDNGERGKEKGERVRGGDRRKKREGRKQTISISLIIYLTGRGGTG